MILKSKTSSPVRRAAAPAPRLRDRLLVAVITSVAFALALLLVIGIEVWLPTTYVRSALGIGFLGVFTTFSSVVTTTDRLAGHGAVGIAAWYLGLSTVAGLAAASLGQVTGASRGDVPGSSQPTVRFDPADPATELAEGRWR